MNHLNSLFADAAVTRRAFLQTAAVAALCALTPAPAAAANVPGAAAPSSPDLGYDDEPDYLSDPCWC